MNTLEELKQLIHTTFGLEPSTLEGDKPLADYGLDSLSLAELMFAVDDHFHVDMPQTPVDIKTLKELADFIDNLKQAKAAP